MRYPIVLATLLAAVPLPALEITKDDNPSLEKLGEVLLSGSLRGRMAAAERLVEDGSERAIHLLLDGMADKFAAYIVTRALLDRVEKDPAAWRGRLDAGMKHPHWRTRMLTAYLLGRIGSPSSSPLLAEALADGNHNVRIYAAQALRTCADKSAVDALLKALQDENGLVRLHAAYALGKAGDRKAVPALVKALGDPDAAINAARSLGRLGGKDAEKALLRTVETPRRKVAWAAIEALGECGTESATALMLRKLAAEAPNERTRNEAAEAARKIQGRTGK